MVDRNEPMFYDIDIEEIATKETNRAQVACWWSGDASLNGLRQMCDCQLGGFFNARPTVSQQGVSWSNAFAIGQAQYLKAKKCTHSEPSKKFRAVSAHLPSGATIQIAA